MPIAVAETSLTKIRRASGSHTPSIATRSLLTSSVLTPIQAQARYAIHDANRRLVSKSQRLQNSWSSEHPQDRIRTSNVVMSRHRYKILNTAAEPRNAVTHNADTRLRSNLRASPRRYTRTTRGHSDAKRHEAFSHPNPIYTVMIYRKLTRVNLTKPNNLSLPNLTQC
jgi:hypothetical protein